MANDFPEARHLLEGTTTEAARALGLKALFEWKAEQQSESRTFTMHGDLGLRVVRIAAAGRQGIDLVRAKEAFLDGQRLPFMAPFLEFSWWLVRTGLAIPGDIVQTTGIGQTPKAGYLVSLILTERGDEFLQSQLPDHPLLPKFAERLWRRCAGMRIEVFNYLSDAYSCYAEGLLRPAIVMLGVAYEDVVRSISDSFTARGHAPKKVIRNATDALAHIRLKLPFLEQKEETRRVASAALDFGDHLRDRRNHSAHAMGPEFDNPVEIEEMIVSSGRHIEVLWGLVAAPFKKTADAGTVT